MQRLPEHRATQVVGQRPPLTHSENAGFLERCGEHRCAVTGGEDQWIADRLQAVAHLDETAVVQRQAGIGQPGSATGLRHPDDLVGRQRLAVAGVQLSVGHRDHFRRAMNDHTTLSQHPLEASPHARVVRRQDVAISGKEVKAQVVGVVAEGLQFVAQAILHRQGQLDAAGAGADQRDGGLPGVPTNTLQQGQPALVEAPDRLHRNGVFGGAFDAVHRRHRADVDRQAVVGHRRAMATEHLALCAVEANHLVAEVAGAGEPGQATQVDVHLVVAVMAGDVARQHSRIRGVGVGADHRQADAGLRPHGKAPEHHDVAVSAADEDDIAEDRLFGYAHGQPPFAGVRHRSATSRRTAARSAAGANRAARCRHWVARRASRPSPWPWLARH